MQDSPIVMLDFETTGMSPDVGARITEVAALRIVEGRIVERFVSLVNCGVQVPAFITGLTGITQRMVNGAPPAAEVVPRLVEFIGRDALAAHNAGFDEKFLMAESARMGLCPAHGHLICSLKLARRLLPGLPSYRLGAVAASVGIRFSGSAHRAEADAEVTAKLLIHISAHIRDTYGLPVIDAELLASINRQTAAKVPRFLQKLMSVQPA
jgi:DNA polymerase-3 subunit epsilon